MPTSGSARTQHLAKASLDLRSYGKSAAILLTRGPVASKIKRSPQEGQRPGPSFTSGTGLGSRLCYSDSVCHQVSHVAQPGGIWPIGQFNYPWCADPKSAVGTTGCAGPAFDASEPAPDVGFPTTGPRYTSRCRAWYRDQFRAPPPSDQQRWQQMVMAPFENIG